MRRYMVDYAALMLTPQKFQEQLPLILTAIILAHDASSGRGAPL